MRNFFLLLLFTFSSLTGFSQSADWQKMEYNKEAQARHENALVAVGNKLVLIGGRGEKEIDIYDVETRRWSRGAQPPMEVHHMQAVELHGLIYVLGGFTGSWPYETPLSHILIYDITEDFWTIGPEIPAGRRRGAAGVVVYEDKIYMVSGIINGHTSGWVNWLDEFDPYSNTWKQLPNAPQARDHFQAAVIDDHIYVAGGRRSGSGETGFSGTVQEASRYNFITQQWEILPDIPTQRAGTAAAVYNNNYVVIGGESAIQEQAHNEVEMFNSRTGSWEKLVPMDSGRHGTQAISLKDRIIIGAGSENRGGGPELNTFEIFSSEELSDLTGNFPEALEKGSLEISEEPNTSPENGLVKVTVKNPSQKGMFISYLLTDDRENFKIKDHPNSPIILAPGSNLTIEIERQEAAEENPSAKLFIKSLGNSEPLIFPLSK